MFKIGFMPMGNMMQWPAEKLCGFVREAGYDAIELQAWMLSSEGKTEADRKKFVSAARENRLLISELVTQRDFVQKEEEARRAAVDEVIANIRVAAEMGVDTINLYTGPVPWAGDPLVVGRDVTQSQAWDWVFAAFDRLIPVAEENRVRLAVENVWGMLCHDFFTHQYLQARYDSPWLGVNFDPSHDVLCGHMDMRFLVRGWREKIFHVHLKDAVGVPEMGRFVFPLLGEGTVDFPALFAALKESGYDGVLSVEFESWGHLKNSLDGRFEDAAPLSREIIGKWMRAC